MVEINCEQKLALTFASYIMTHKNQDSSCKNQHTKCNTDELGNIDFIISFIVDYASVKLKCLHSQFNMVYVYFKNDLLKAKSKVHTFLYEDRCYQNSVDLS